MAESVAIDLYADPRVRAAISRIRAVVPEADLSQAVRAAVLYVAEGVPEHEIQVYLEEQINLSEG
ncbi:MAG TPA: hypothetical protein VJ768_05825 [Anaerolineales bacterium]|jgi:hypothetical protein|nr:hypothetical protein [Anaerolineales bacterium]